MRDRRQSVRLLAAAIVIAAFLALAGLAIAASRSSFSLGLPASAEQPQAAAPAPVAPAPSDGSSMVGLLASPAADLPPVPDAAGGPAVVDDASSGAPTTPTTLAPPPALATAPAGGACPQLGLLSPDEVGGLQSLIALVPFFGPFSPEAFALMPAFEPGFRALGPLFPVIEDVLAQGKPLLDAGLPVVQQISQVGFGLLSPLYTPYRPEVLAAEKRVAAQLAPLVQRLATAPGTDCLIALEGVVAGLVR